MRYSFRLAELVGHTPDPKKRPGTIKQICEFTGLDRHQVAALLKNEVKYIPLEAISKLCDYLIDRRYAKPGELPGRLFALEPEHFWELLARRRRMQLCLGVRREKPEDSLDDAWVVASDSVLLGELLNGVTTLRGAASKRMEEFRTDEPVAEAPVSMESHSVAPHPENLRQLLVWSPGQISSDQCHAMALGVYDQFNNLRDDKALVVIGSMKSNPMADLVLADAFGCEPFQTQDNVQTADKRACPLFLRFRDHDPQNPSCWGGMKLSAEQAAKKPGIYYETDDGTWDAVTWEENKQDAAFVFYVHRESQGCLQLALGGYSGRATRMLARYLARHGEEFWPPNYEGHGLQVGAFVVKFTLTGSASRDRTSLTTDQPFETEIIRLDRSVIERRMLSPGDEEEA